MKVINLFSGILMLVAPMTASTIGSITVMAGNNVADTYQITAVNGLFSLVPVNTQNYSLTMSGSYSEANGHVDYTIGINGSDGPITYSAYLSLDTIGAFNVVRNTYGVTITDVRTDGASVTNTSQDVKLNGGVISSITLGPNTCTAAPGTTNVCGGNTSFNSVAAYIPTVLSPNLTLEINGTVFGSATITSLDNLSGTGQASLTYIPEPGMFIVVGMILMGLASVRRRPSAD